MNAKKILKREGRPLPYNPTRQYVRTAPYLPQRGKVASGTLVFPMTDEVLLTVIVNEK